MLQVPSTSKWGREFVYVPTPRSVPGDTLKIIARSANTDIDIITDTVESYNIPSGGYILIPFCEYIYWLLICEICFTNRAQCHFSLEFSEIFGNFGNSKIRHCERLACLIGIASWYVIFSRFNWLEVHTEIKIICQIIKYTSFALSGVLYQALYVIRLVHWYFFGCKLPPTSFAALGSIILYSLFTHFMD